MRRVSTCGLTLLWVTLVGGVCRAEEAGAPSASVVQGARSDDPFSRRFAVAAYGTGWEGSYGGAGVGGRARWEAFRYLGLDLFAEALAVQSPHGGRRDYPIGFNLFVPFRLSERWRLRALLGMCAVMSFIDASEPGAPPANDVLLGLHTGAGAEVALSEGVSLFGEVQAVSWMGHDRAVQGWTGAVGNDLRAFAVAQVVVGLSLHVGRR